MKAPGLLLFATALWAQSDVAVTIQRALDLERGAAVADIASGDDPELSMAVTKDVGSVVYVDIDPATAERRRRS
jgi:hypothetical protein